MTNITATAGAPNRVQGSNPFQPAGPLARYRLTLTKGQTYSLSSSMCEIRVLSGVACMLENGHEIVLNQGEKRVVTMGYDGLLMPASDDMPLIFEIALDAASEEGQRMKRQFYERMAKRQQVIEVESRNDSQK
jgi:hypothetical protein